MRMHQVWVLGFLTLSGCWGTVEDQPLLQPLVGGGAGVGSVGPGGAPAAFGGNGIGGGVFPGQPPVPGAVFSATQPPAPVSGGTLLVLADQVTAVVADPDRDQVVVVDLESMSVSQLIQLPALSEPGRAVQGADGQVHLVLRGSGQLVTFDPKTGAIAGTRNVCRYPRGLAVSDAESVVHVACSEGRLVTLSSNATELTPSRDLQLDRDLRDVVLAPDGLWVSRFRSAEILRLDAAGALLHRYRLPSRNTDRGETVAAVAWRMIQSPKGGVIVVHQRAFAGEVVPQPGGYGSSGFESSIVESAISEVHDDGEVLGASAVVSAPLPVDVAYSAISDELLLASAAVEHPSQPNFMPRSRLVGRIDMGLTQSPSLPLAFAFGDEAFTNTLPTTPLVAVAFANDVPVLQFREPSSLMFGSRGLSLPGDAVTDTGSNLFHLQTASSLACASCHPEGLEDGRVWTFSGFGARRTQPIRGGLLQTAPFHWDGLETDFQALTNDVMANRMGGPQLSPEQANALAGYIDRLPALTLPSADMTPAAARGKQLFEDATVGCATCHSGPRFTDNKTVDVGSGQLQVPGLLGLWSRAPYLHDGCAQTIAERFTAPCHHEAHGNLTGLTADDLAALSAYLETL